MNVRIFWVCVMEYMCAQTRPRFILSPKRVWGEWSQKQCQLLGKVPSTGGSEEVQTCDAASCRTARPKHCRLSYSSHQVYINKCEYTNQAKTHLIHGFNLSQITRPQLHLFTYTLVCLLVSLFLSLSLSLTHSHSKEHQKQSNQNYTRRKKVNNALGTM